MSGKVFGPRLASVNRIEHSMEEYFHPLNRPQLVLREPTAKKGLLLIPDISGFTRFVSTTDIEVGKSITSRLLLSILERDILDLVVSEVEGDAILFYKTGEVPSLEKILEQFEYLLEGFNTSLKNCSAEFNRPLGLSLKLIAHYGEIAEYNVGGFRKLYGAAVIEAHYLLKNSLNSQSYVLVTDALMKVASDSGQTALHFDAKASKLCEVYGELRNICFTCFDYEVPAR